MDAKEDGVQHWRHDQGQDGGACEPEHDAHRHRPEERIHQQGDHPEDGGQHDHAHRSHLADAPIKDRLVGCLPFVALGQDLAQDDDLILDLLAAHGEHPE